MSHRAGPIYGRILVTRLKFIGDIVLTTPLLRSLRESCAGAYIAYLGERSAVSLLEGNPHLDEIIPFDFTRPTVREQSRVAMLLRRRKFDLVLDLFGNPRSALLTYVSGAPVRVGPDRKGRGRLYTLRVRDDGRPKSAVAFHNQYLQAAGISSSAVRTEIFLSEEERERGRREVARILGVASYDPDGPPVVGLHPGATWPAKRWPAGRFGTLAQRIQSELGARVVLTAGPGDMEVLRGVRTGAAQDLPAIAGAPLRLLASAIAACSVYVANDSGPMHIAAAVGTTTIGLFGPGEEGIWFPYDPADGHVAMRKDVPCHPCHLDFCNRTGEGYMECMHLLTVDEVLAEVGRALARSRGRRAR
jgi:lipopolysaccharide heptosyltransferase II